MLCEACGKNQIYTWLDVEINKYPEQSEVRVCNICEECLIKIDPDMWISKEIWEDINPVVPFEELRPYDVEELVYQWIKFCKHYVRNKI